MIKIVWLHMIEQIVQYIDEKECYHNLVQEQVPTTEIFKMNEQSIGYFRHRNYQEQIFTFCGLIERYIDTPTMSTLHLGLKTCIPASCFIYINNFNGFI